MAPLAPLRTRLDAWLASFDTDALLAGQPGRRRPRPRRAPGRDRGRPPAERGRGGPGRRAQPLGRLGLEPAPRRRVVAADGRGRRRDRCRSPPCATWPSTPMPAFAGGPTTPSWRRGTRSPCPLAACLNGVKGQGSTLNRRRGWPDDLEPALFTNAVERPVLEAMQRGGRRLAPRLRPLPRRPRPASSATTTARLPVVGPLRAGRRPAGVGASPGTRPPTSSPMRSVRSRPACEPSPSGPSPTRGSTPVPATASAAAPSACRCTATRAACCSTSAAPSTASRTLAHELGHAYHNTQLADRTALQRQTPMALAETASIFCETILVQALPAPTPTTPDGSCCSRPTCRAPARSSSTSTRGSCSSGPSSSSGPAGRCRSPSSASS